MNFKQVLNSLYVRCLAYPIIREFGGLRIIFTGLAEVIKNI
jgi:hypothetical protein